MSPLNDARQTDGDLVHVKCEEPQCDWLLANVLHSLVLFIFLFVFAWCSALVDEWIRLLEVRIWKQPGASLTSHLQRSFFASESHRTDLEKIIYLPCCVCNCSRVLILNVCSLIHKHLFFPVLSGGPVFGCERFKLRGYGCSRTKEPHTHQLGRGEKN